MFERTGRHVMGLLVLAALFAPGESRPTRRTLEGAAPPALEREASDALPALNEASRAAYRRAKEEALARGGPVILVEGDDLVLRYGLYRSKARVTPALYHDLKAIDHVPLALYALLVHRTEGPVDDARLYDLKVYRDLVRSARKALNGRGLSEAQLRRQEQILRRSLALIDGVLKNKRIERKSLTEFARGLRRHLEDNAGDAAQAQLDALHRQARAWRARLTGEEWKRLRVIVMGTQLPRKDNLAVQYFARLLGEAGEGGRIVYSEAIFDEEKALDLLATRTVDGGIGESFFGDAKRMHRDLLADAAKDHLDKMFAKDER